MARRDALPILNPGTPVLLRSDRRVHVGSDPRTALVLEFATAVTIPTLVTVLQRLRTPQHYRHLRREVRASGLTATAFWELMDRLVTAGKATVAPPVGQRPFSVGVIGHGELAEQLLDVLPRDGHAAVPYDQRELFRAGRRRPQLVVVADQPVPDPAVWEPLMAASVPHLTVHVNDDAGVVGPLVLPGLSSCLRCIDLYRADLDPQWPVLAAALQGVAGAASPATCSATAALAHAQITEIAHRLRVGSAEPPSLTGRIMEFRPLPSSLQTVAAPTHPRCVCQVKYGLAPRAVASTILEVAAKGLH